VVKLTRIYTRTGDDGTTGLVDGSRIAKADTRVAVIGDVDEANSQVGVAIAALDGDSLHPLLTRIQNDLFDLGADVATPGEDFTPSASALRIVAAQVERLEREIDTLNAAMPPLSSFVLPGGSAGAAALHVARATVRRAERSAAAMASLLNPQALAYLNRLSDLLFVAARAANGNGAGDVLWVPGQSR